AGRNGTELVAAVSSLREPRTTMGGVNLVAGFRPELWRVAVPDDAPDEVHGFNDPIAGVEEFTMPGTQHDAVLWLSGSAYDVIFDVARMAIRSLAEVATIGEETSSWPYRHDPDVLGTIFRRSMPFGTVTDHGSRCVGFCARQEPLQKMLESMAGLDDGSRDALTRYTRAVTGAYYFVPSTDSLRALVSPEE